jgi:hypothetical protein
MNKSLYLTSLLIIICITFSACNREKLKSNEAKTANTTTEEKSSTTSTTKEESKSIDGTNTHSETKEASNSNNNNTKAVNTEASKSQKTEIKHGTDDPAKLDSIKAAKAKEKFKDKP